MKIMVREQENKSQSKVISHLTRYKLLTNN